MKKRPRLTLLIVALLTLLVALVTAASPPTRTPSPAPVTFAEHIAPIVFQNCATCHRPDGAAPFALVSYADVAKRAKQIAKVTDQRIMPPWHAETGSYPFKDERRLTADQIALIQQWLQQGMPKGDLTKLPPVPEMPSGWQLGPPDLIVELPVGYQVPADGPDVYRNFVVPLNLASDKWVRAIELHPSARTVVHHVLFFADTSGAAREADAADAEPGFPGMGGRRWRNAPLGGWALGSQPHMYPDGVSLPLRKGSDLVFQYHFHPSGKPETERSVIGLYFADKAPERTLTAIQLPPLFGVFSGIDIPAGQKEFRVRDSFVLPVDVDAVAIGAHAHYLGREMKMTATLPSGEQKTLLWIKRWDFAWQDRYYFKDFVTLPKGTRLDGEVVWDNSADNPDNPSDPPKRVTWGEQSTDEMGSVGMQVLPHRESDLATLQQAYRQHVREMMFSGDGLRGLRNLRDVRGAMQAPRDTVPDARGTLTADFFVTHDCPISNHYAPEIRRICDSYAARGVACRLVYVDPSLSDADALAHARTYHLDAPSPASASMTIVVDRDHRLVREAGATIAPEVVVMTPEHRIAYRGRIDDFYVAWGQSRRQVRTHDLRDALDALLAGRPVPQSETEPVGCIISDLQAHSGP